MRCKTRYKAANTTVCVSHGFNSFSVYNTHWHLQRGRLGSKPPKRQQISGVPVPGSGMDTPSPWRRGPDWEAGNNTAMEKCIVVKERKMERDTKQHIARKRHTALTIKILQENLVCFYMHIYIFLFFCIVGICT